MRLLDVNSSSLELVEFFGDQIPPYAILSHTWEKDEVLFRDLERQRYKHKLGYRKIEFTCEQARRDGLRWCWVDTCCIDKSSSAELSEAINSMFNWYKRAKVCYAYLTDVDAIASKSTSGKDPIQPHRLITAIDVTVAQYRSGEPSTPEAKLMDSVLKAVKDSRWFSRGWTLQELIAPCVLRFYDLNWYYLGDRDKTLSGAVIERTGLDSIVLGKPDVLRDIPIAQRMSWMSSRQTTRKEDESYCMLGIFGVNMPLLYGEEEMAFMRLQEELVKRFRDHSLLMFSEWSPNTMFHQYPYFDVSPVRRTLATSPRAFAWCKDIKASGTFQNLFPLQPYRLTQDGIHISLPLIQSEKSGWQFDLGLFGYAYHDLLVGLVLKSGVLYGEKEARYVMTIVSHGFREKVTPLRWLGNGIVFVPKEIAVTAKSERILLGAEIPSQGVVLNDFSHLPESQSDLTDPDTWLRYDVALRFEMASPDCVLNDTVAKQQGRRPLHMIWLRSPFRSLPVEPPRIMVLKFSSEKMQHLAVIVTLAHESANSIRGTLLLTEKQRVDTEERLVRIGTDFLSETKDDSVFRKYTDDCQLASVHIEGIGMLELRYDGFGALAEGHARVTLLIRGLAHEPHDKCLLSDGTEV